VGIETVAQVAELNVTELTQVTGMTDTEAAQTLSQAEAAVQQGEAGG
jgi:predicted RecB family nuclease